MEDTARYLIVRDHNTTPYLLSLSGDEVEWTSDREHGARHRPGAAAEVLRQLSGHYGAMGLRSEPY